MLTNISSPRYTSNNAAIDSAYGFNWPAIGV